MSVFFDTSVLVGLFFDDDALAKRSRRIAIDENETVAISDFVAAEFASVIARLQRMGNVTLEQAHEIFVRFNTTRRKH